MKRTLSILLAVLMIFSILPQISLASGFQWQEPNLTLKNMEIPVLEAGKLNTIRLQFENVGNASNIVVTPVLGEGTPFTPSNITDSVNVTNSSQPFDLKLNVRAGTPNGTYHLKLTANYSYVTGVSAEGYPSISQGTKDISIYVQIVSKGTQPKLLVKNVTTEPKSIGPGQTFLAKVEYENIGDAPISNISTTLEGLSNEGLFLASGSNQGYISNVPTKGKGTILYNLRASTAAKKGTYELSLTFEYGTTKETQKIYITLDSSASTDSNLAMENMSFPTKNIGVGGTYTLTFDLTNKGTIPTSNIIVKAESADVAAVVPTSTSIIKIASIAPGEKKPIRFTFSPTKSSITRNYPIVIKIEYEDQFSGGSKYELEQYVGINVYSPDTSATGKTSKPKLIVDKYSFNPTMVKAGENFDMNLSFFNTNAAKSVKNIKIFLTTETITDPNKPSSGGSVFTPIDSSNTFYIDSIGPKGKVEKTIKMFTVPDAAAKTYTLTANFEYEDSQGNEFTATELIGVPVVQVSKMDVGEINFMPEAFVGQPNSVSLQYYNTGKVTLYNLMVKIEGEGFTTQNGQNYVGNFQSGSSEYFEGQVVPTQTGEIKGAVVFSFEDSTGQTKEVRKEFSMNVMDAPPMPDPGEFPMPEPEKTGFAKYAKFIIPLVILAAIIGGVVIYRRRKHKKSEEDLDLNE